MKPPARIFAETHKVWLQTSEDGRHEIDIAIGYIFDGHASVPVEIVFVGRGKIGNGMDLLLTNLGIALSRILQSRDPNTSQDLQND